MISTKRLLIISLALTMKRYTFCNQTKTKESLLSFSVAFKELFWSKYPPKTYFINGTLRFYDHENIKDWILKTNDDSNG